MPLTGSPVPPPYSAPFDGSGRASRVQDPWAYLAIDVRVGIRDTSDRDLGGNILSLQLFSVKPNASQVFFQNYLPGQPCPSGANVFGCVNMFNSAIFSDFGAPTLQPNGQWQTFDVDFMPIIDSLKNQWTPPGYTIEDMEVRGFDVYTSSRGASLEYSLKDIDLVGISW